MSNTALKSHFAKMCGTSTAAIGQGCKKGLIKTVTVSGKEVVNLSHRLTKEYLALHTGSEKAPKVEKPKKSKKTKKAPAKVDKKEPPKDEDEKIEGEDEVFRPKSLEEITSKNIIHVEKRDLDKFKVYEQALETKLKREERRGDLIPRKMVRQAFSKLYQIYVNQFKTAEDRLVPDICAIFGHPDSSPEAVKLRELIETDTAKGLTHTHRTFNDFLRKVKAEKI